MSSEEESGYERLNILLSKEALAKLDLLKFSGGFSSRGRTIEEAILAADDIMQYSLLIVPSKKDKVVDEPTLRNFAMLTIMRLARLGFAKWLSEWQKMQQ